MVFTVNTYPIEILIASVAWLLDQQQAGDAGLVCDMESPDACSEALAAASTLGVPVTRSARHSSGRSRRKTPRASLVALVSTAWGTRAAPPR
jgi:hypothetical protein